MARTARLVRSVGLASIVALAGTPALAVDGFEGYEAVTIRVTLEGPVDPMHTFAVRQACAEEQCVTEDFVILCAPPPNAFGWLACSADTYEYTVMVRAGLTFEYALLRWTAESTQDEPEEHLEGSLLVREGAQTISLGYVYPSAVTLPDTALPVGH
jgi:hypothetical protein